VAARGGFASHATNCCVDAYCPMSYAWDRGRAIGTRDVGRMFQGEPFRAKKRTRRSRGRFERWALRFQPVGGCVHQYRGRLCRGVLAPFVAAAMLWGHCWDAENAMTIPSMIAPAAYRGTASGFAYLFVKLPAFLTIFLFPSFFSAIGKGNATPLVALFPLIGLIAAIFLLPRCMATKSTRPLGVAETAWDGRPIRRSA
jgi:hypothetical protein